MIEQALPSNIDAERAVLGSIIINPEALVQVADFLFSEMFYRNAHCTIYEAMLALYARREPADFITLTDELERVHKLDEVGGMSYILSLSNEVPTSNNAEHYARIVERTARLRKLLAATGEIAAKAYAQDEDALSYAEQAIFRISASETAHTVTAHTDVLSRYLDNLTHLLAQSRKGIVTGVPTGYKYLDKLLGGLRTSKMLVLAARPGVGKTSLALNIAATAVKSGLHVLFFSLEMDEDELMQRWVSMEAGIDSTKLRDGKLSDLEEERVYDAISRLATLDGKLWIDDTCGLSHQKMRSKAMRMRMEHGVDLIIVDYLQLAKAEESDVRRQERRLEVEEVSRNLKGIARELNVPVLALAQLSRAVEQRASKIPQLSDLREAGGIEQDADVVMFIHKDDQIAKDAPEYTVNLMIEKHRSGPVGIIPLRFIAAQTRYVTVVPEVANHDYNEY